MNILNTVFSEPRLRSEARLSIGRFLHLYYLVFHNAIGWFLIRSIIFLSLNKSSGMYSPLSNLFKNSFSSFVKTIRSEIYSLTSFLADSNSKYSFVLMTGLRPVLIFFLVIESMPLVSKVLFIVFYLLLLWPVIRQVYRLPDPSFQIALPVPSVPIHYYKS